MSNSCDKIRSSKFKNLPLATSGPQQCALTGAILLQDPYFNKGSAFTAEERKQFKLHSLLPPNVQTLEEQANRAYQQFSDRDTDMARNEFMTSLKAQNEVLYYKLLQDHLKEMLPVIYTPTEGEAIANYSRIFRKPEGCFLNVTDMDRIEDNLNQWGSPSDIDLIVVSDGEQILGIGDQGVGAILISVAKLVLYTACAGVHPSRTLPVVLDCGTNNRELLDDELYLGLRKNRIRGEQYDKFIDLFVQSAKKLYPNAYIHFEDFGLHNARRILDRYTPQIPCFNDDVQGTGCATLAALMAALKVNSIEWKNVRIVMFGAGSAGTGIADQIRDAIAVEIGKSKEDAAQHIWCMDKPGLLLKSMKGDLTETQTLYAREDSDWSGNDTKDLLSIVKRVKPHILIGTSTVPGAFSEQVVKEMANHVERPIIFPLSNPTRLHEAKPQDIYTWTKGKALIATGSPFPPVEFEGSKYEVAECNNSVAFPGIGLGAILSRAKRMPPSLLVAATKALAEQAPANQDPNAGLLPDVTHVREVSAKIAVAVVKAAVEEGLNNEKNIPENKDDLEEWIREQMWDPIYRPLQYVDAKNASASARGEVGVASTRRRATEH